MTNEFLLPEIGEGVVEGEIVEWLVVAGDAVDVDQPLVSVLTDKATVEIAADFSGTITKTVGAAGDVVEVGSVLATYDASGEAAAEEPESPKNAGEASVSEAPKNGNLIEFPLPEIGEGVMEGEVVEWLVKVGDEITHDQPIVSVLTDKATVEITAPANGTVVETVGDPGDMVDVGSTIMKLRSSDVAPAAAKAEAPAKAAEPSQKAKPKAVSPAVSPEDNPSISAFGTPLATPAVRKLASSMGVDLRTVQGSGPNHRITKADVEQAKAAPSESPKPKQAPPSPSAAPAAAAASSGEPRRERLKGLRKAIHGSMTKSKSIIPHFTYVDEVEMDALVAMRTQLKPVAEAEGIKLTYLPFIAKAVVFALKKYPILNASMDDEAGEIVYHQDYNLGIAAATQDGLTVPVLKHADQKTILQIASEMVELTDRARNRRSTLDDISGGTFTLTSLGRIGGLLSTPIINHPEVGILGIHNLQPRAVVRDGEIVIRQMMNLALSFDHRLVDGDVGAVFTQEIKSYLEDPGKLLLYMT